jgi:hypothetical protein
LNLSFNYLKFLLVLLLLISGKTFFLCPLQSQTFYDGEELYYEVSYSFINIGWAKFNTKALSGKPNFYTTTAKLKSNEGIPLVKVDYEFTSDIEVKDGVVRPHRFLAYQFVDGGKITITHDFNYDSNYIIIKKVEADGFTSVDKKIYTSTVFQDGLSIFYFARNNAGKNSTQTVPVIMHVDTASMQVSFTSAKTDVSIEPVEYDVASTFVDGFSHFKAVFGLTGDFSGWFSADDARVPLKAKLQVEIGNITLELKEWKRGSWQPPKY